MTERILMLTMVALGIGISTVTPVNVRPGLVKAFSWLISGASKFL